MSNEKKKVARQREGDDERVGGNGRADATASTSALARSRSRREGGNEQERERSKSGAGGEKGGKSAAKASGGVVWNVRVSSAMNEAASKAVEESPIEFQTVSDFVRRAVETELRRRGLLKTYKE